MFNPIIHGVGLRIQLRYGNATKIIATRTLISRIENFQHMLKTRLSTAYSGCESFASQYVTLLVSIICSLELVANFFPHKNNSFIDS